ncbi:molybdenum ABC transporter ATP-binding protein [Curtobacterium sp. MCBD17_034]|uniref:ABC transporter ATP-binding protein n=1 Tax=unclassified Curtobacterium TaxID=257496 RepID=UPI000DA87FEC|nr:MULTISPECIES: ABC transporter ATP-binding protein [unclassified Curtobacterium]PZF56664.1 molybdenum ABC transporter ATP-binding protein [Curtobacterium sp. MCBD17_034]PZM33303.1 molybdenum ABC transporter ATP-binding protein [Curtobacterium sp. MCBD17_031]
MTATVLRFGVTARDVVVDLTIAPGEVVALVGPNGAGKSTVVGVAAGLVRPDAGEVLIAGQPVVRGRRSLVPVYRRGVGLVGQDPVLFPHRSVLENVAYGPRATRLGRRAAHGRALAALTTVGAEHLASRWPSSLSGGQAQRVAVARALATAPRVLLLDEPTSALDVEAQREVRQALAAAVRGRDAAGSAAVLLVTHDPLEAMALADRVVVLERGRVVEDGPVDRVLRRPTSAFGAAFSGLTSVSGHAVAGGVRLASGEVLPADTVDAEPGAVALAVYHPTVARLGRPGGAPSAILRRVDRIEPRDGLVRVVAGEFVVDATVAAVTASSVRVGAEVAVGLPADEVTVFPSSAG